MEMAGVILVFEKRNPSESWILYLPFLTIVIQYINAVSEKAIALNTVYLHYLKHGKVM